MATKEIITGNYMEALLRASLLLGDLHRTTPIREITISAFQLQNHVRRLAPRCRIISQDAPYENAAEDYLILYPGRTHAPS